MIDFGIIFSVYFEVEKFTESSLSNAAKRSQNKYVSNGRTMILYSSIVSMYLDLNSFERLK